MLLKAPPFARVLILNIPALIVVAPVYVLAADAKVNVPLPVFVIPPVPVIMPPKVVEVLSLPRVSVPEPKDTVPPVFMLANEPIWPARLFKVRVTPEALFKITWLLSGKEF